MNESNINNGFNEEEDIADMQKASDDGDNCKITINQVSTTQDTSPQEINVEMRLDTSSIRNNTNPANARNILIRFQQFKWSILAFICGVILTLVIIVPVMVSKSSSQENDSPFNFTLKFDRKLTSTFGYISTDHKIISNIYTRETPNFRRHTEELGPAGYHGVLGDRTFKSTDKIYFEIKYTFTKLFTIHEDTTSRFARVGLVYQNTSFDYWDPYDFDYYFGDVSDGWYIYFHICNFSVCLSFDDYGMSSDAYIKLSGYNNPTRSSLTGRLGFFINMERREFSVIDKATMQILHTYVDVSSAEDILSIFTVDYQLEVGVQIEISYSYNFQKLPVYIVIA